MNELHPSQLQLRPQPVAVPLGPVHPAARQWPTDEELPPSARSAVAAPPAAETPVSPAAPRPAARPRRLWAALLLGGALLFALPWWPGQHGEQSHANWTHHTQVDKLSKEQKRGPSGNPLSMKWVSKWGPATFGDAIPVSQEDWDGSTTTTVRAALARNDLAAANLAVQQAQRGIVLTGTAAQPAIPGSMLAEKRTLRFVHIRLYDSCDEDGDVVDVLVDGQRFATVPLTHRGALLSVPVHSAGPTSLAIRGAVDGSGGITVGCQTSEGQGFTRVLRFGEEMPLSLGR